MAVTPIAFKLNGDNENWNDGHLLDELEKVFSQLGWHSGTIRYGVPHFVAPAGAPTLGGTAEILPRDTWDGQDGNKQNYNFSMRSGGYVSPITVESDYNARRFDVTKDGTDHWVLQEYWKPTSVDASTNTITFPSTTSYYTDDGTKVNTFSVTGKKVVWMPDDSAGSNNIGGLTPGNTYYVIRVSDTEIKLADTYADAVAGTNVKNLAGDPTSGVYLYDTTNKQIFREAIGTDNNNGSVNNKDREVTILQGDTVEYHFPNNDIAEFRIVNQSLANGDTYSSTKELSTTNRDALNYNGRPNTYFSNVANAYPTSISGEHTTGNYLKWYTNGWGCSEDQMPDYWIDEPGNGSIPALDSITPGNRSASNNPNTHPDGHAGTAYPNAYKWYPRNEYWYVSAANPTSMQGKISIRGRCHNPYFNYHDHNPFWYVTVNRSTGGGATTGATDLKLRIERNNNNQNNNSYKHTLRKVEILNVASTATNAFDANTGQNGGWADSPTFTIDGVLSGGVTSTNDIVFGTNTAESSSNLNDGTLSLHSTDYKGVGGWWQRDKNDKWAILRVENQSDKKYGVTFYAFCFDYRSTGNTDTTYGHLLTIQSGIYWNSMNHYGPNDPVRRGTYYNKTFGTWAGQVGTEIQTLNYLNCNLDSTSTKVLSFTSTNNPYTYKHEVRLYQAPNTQDSNFAVISFVGYQSNTPILYDSFVLHKGNTFGNPNPGVDMDYLHVAGVTQITPRNSSSVYHATINLETYMPAFYAANANYSTASSTAYAGCATVPIGTSGMPMTRNYLYGYLRDSHKSKKVWRDSYGQNIFDTTGNTQNQDDESNYTWATIYHRDVAYEGISNTEANFINFYKPISGIPICNKFIPCPYYIPDDFVLIQVNTAPNAVDYRVGDTVTISGNEKYSVVVSSYQQNVNGLDNPSDSASTNTAAMLFCVRIAN